MASYYELTKEGKEYLKEGLPEKNLVEILKKRKEISFQEAQKKVKNFHIALKWAMDKRWVRKKKDRIILLKVPKEIPEQDILKKLDKGEEVEEKILEILLKRNLAKKVVIGKVDELIGKTVTNLTPELIKTGLWKKVKFAPVDENLPSKKIIKGGIQPYRKIIDEVRKKLIDLGFVEARGPLVEMNFWNCDALFMPSDHPARNIHDIFFVKEPKCGKVLDKELWKKVEDTHVNGWTTGSKGWGYWNKELAQRLILRSQGTAVSARVMYKLRKEQLPYKMFLIDKVFRPDVIDAKHFIEFEHCEGIVVGEGLNLRHLLGYLKTIAETLGAEKVRFKPSYFPFTEGSTELQVYIKDLGWVEAGGAGIFRPEVTLPLGIDVPVLAWGLGIGRLAMIKLGIKDIRHLYSDDLNWLRSKK